MLILLFQNRERSIQNAILKTAESKLSILSAVLPPIWHDRSEKNLYVRLRQNMYNTDVKVRKKTIYKEPREKLNQHSTLV
jgi:hypothetical protein